MNLLNLLRRKKRSDQLAYEWPKPLWKKILCFPLDVIYFHVDLLHDGWEFLRWMTFTKPKCFYCDTAANAALTEKRNAVAARYTNLWMARILCPCTQPPDPDICSVPYCKSVKRKRLHILPIGLLTLMAWAGLGIGISSYPPARRLARRVLPKQTTQQLKKLVPMKNPLQRARTMVEEKNFMEARIAYMNAVQQNPSNALVRAEFAEVLLEMELWGQALRELKATTQLNPTNQQAVAQFVTLSALARQAKQALPAAIKLAEALPDQVQPRLILAAAYSANKDLPKAVGTLKAIKDHPDLTAEEAYQAGSMAVNQMRARSLAEHFYRRTVSLAPENLAAHIQLSKIDRLSGRHEQAKKALAEAEKLDPGHYEVIAEQAEHLLLEGKFDQALSTMKRAQERNAAWAYLKARYAEMLLMGRRFDESKQLAEQLVESRSPREQAMGHTVLAQIYLDKQLYPDAAESARAAVELDGTHYRQHTMLARAQMARKEFEAAQTALDAAIELEPELLELRLTDAQLAYAQGKLTNGLAKVAAIASQENLSPVTILQIAALTFQNQQIEAARTWFAQVHQAYPDNPVAASGLVNCNLLLGQDPSGTHAIAKRLASRFPESVEFAMAYAEVLVAVENTTDYLPELEQLAAHFAFSPEAHYFLGKAYFLTKRPAEARKELEETLKMAPRHEKAAEIRAMLEKLP